MKTNTTLNPALSALIGYCSAAATLADQWVELIEEDNRDSTDESADNLDALEWLAKEAAELAVKHVGKVISYIGGDDFNDTQIATAKYCAGTYNDLLSARDLFGDWQADIDDADALLTEAHWRAFDAIKQMLAAVAPEYPREESAPPTDPATPGGSVPPPRSRRPRRMKDSRSNACFRSTEGIIELSRD